MTLTVNGQAAQPGCYVEGHWGQYGPDHFADQLEGFGLVIPKGIDPRRYRRIREWVEERSAYPHYNGPLANVYLACLEDDRELENFANDATEGGYWEWDMGECFLRSYVCPECGRDATLPVDGPASDDWHDGMAEVAPCDWCCDADDPGCFA
jgi:hypothetical protein